MNENKHTYPGSSPWRLRHLLPLLPAVLLFTVAGCWKDSLPGVRQLKLNFYNASQAGSGAIREIEVFVFDDQQQLSNRATGTIDGTLSLDRPRTTTLHCIAWGNSNDKSLRLPVLQPGDPLDGAYLTLTPLSPAKDGTQYLNTPPNLFRGAIETDNKTIASQPSFNMKMQPTTASINITISGLAESTPTETGDYAIVVNGSPARIDFEGNYSGNAVHRLTGSFNTQKEYIIPPFRLFPSVAGKGIRIDIDHNGKLLESITKTSNGQPLLPEKGKELALLIKFIPGGVEVKLPGEGPTDVEVVYPK
ncbi:FimB/Mfa2 family fimbrial subunit [Parabacteroides sp. GYB001]|uniref:FimB/Mfa2 family fimbrial subunit n=1 Tax=Parabacteroides leei TaxID=2939491 RepID=UPI00201838F1|nr:FimB/Mfa2 family fimbrial subunit [Parabacteroides leei]MCL3849710.1 FimB/Mfa2 family fimbrial subunit [Parabacteroides leei]